MYDIISPEALALLMSAKRDDQMIFVRTKDELTYDFEGRILDLTGDKCTIEATDGEVCHQWPVDRLLHIDIRPLRHYDGYGARQFVEDVTNGPGWNR